MAQEIELSRGDTAKIRSFGVGFGLTVLTFGIYYYCWYYLVNDELRELGRATGDEGLARSNPAMSLLAILLGGFLIVPPLLSVYNYGQRIKRAQRLAGVAPDEQINPLVAFLLLVPGGILIVPAFVHYWYVTKHQNAALRAAAGLPAAGSHAGLAAGVAA